MPVGSARLGLGGDARGAGQSHQLERRLDPYLSQHSTCPIGSTARGCDSTHLGEQHRQAFGKVGVGRIDAHRSPHDVDRAIDLASIVRCDRSPLDRGNDPDVDRITMLGRPSDRKSTRLNSSHT